MQLGVFIPISNNGWLISTTSPQYKPTFDLNRTIVEKAEAFGFNFALSMIKLHGFGGPSEFWDYNLESFTLMAGLAAVTIRIQLFATCAVLTMPPPSVARLVAANKETGQNCGALVLTMIIADETDATAQLKWEHYKDGADLEALAYRDEQAEDDLSKDPFSQPNRRKILGSSKLPTNQGVLVRSYESVARMLDELSEVPAVRGVMMTFDDFVIGIEQFGTRILPRMRSREAVKLAAD